MSEIQETPATTEAGVTAPSSEFYLATVTGWSNDNGVRIQIDGQEAGQKSYKMMLMARPLHVGARVVAMKQAGTYVVLGEVSNPNSWKRMTDLESDASTSTIVSKVNELLAWLRTQGILWT